MHLRRVLQIFVASKFDNRLKEFGERWEVDKYLAATGYLPATVRPFFVALPKVGIGIDTWVKPAIDDCMLHGLSQQ